MIGTGPPAEAGGLCVWPRAGGGARSLTLLFFAC